jgi:uncharacterized protein
MMSSPEQKRMLRIFIDETDRSGEVPLYEAIVRKLARLEVAGATVEVRVMGSGKHGRVHRKRLFGISDDRPVTITIVDDDATLLRIPPEIRPMIKEGLMLMQDVEVVT